MYDLKNVVNVTLEEMKEKTEQLLEFWAEKDIFVAKGKNISLDVINQVLAKDCIAFDIMKAIKELGPEVTQVNVIDFFMYNTSSTKYEVHKENQNTTGKKLVKKLESKFVVLLSKVDGENTIEILINYLI